MAGWQASNTKSVGSFSKKDATKKVTGGQKKTRKKQKVEELLKGIMATFGVDHATASAMFAEKTAADAQKNRKKNDKSRSDL